MPIRDIIVIAASAGGVETLGDIVAPLPADLPAALLIVLHVLPQRVSILPRILARGSRLPVAHAKNGEPPEHGRIYVAPPDCHMIIEDGIIRLDHGPRENFTRPAADPLFRSAAAAYGARVMGIVLTGGDGDGGKGLKAIKAAGGLTVVQDPDEAQVPSMPLSGLREDSPDYCLRAREIPALIARMAGSPVAHPEVEGA